MPSTLGFLMREPEGLRLVREDSTWKEQGRAERLRGRAGVEQRQRRLDRTNGLCEHCLAEDRVTIATVVNHKVPLAHGGPDTDENTENLCREHDLKVTATQFGHERQSRLGAVDASGRPTDPDHPWNRAGG